MRNTGSPSSAARALHRTRLGATFAFVAALALSVSSFGYAGSALAASTVPSSKAASGAQVRGTVTYAPVTLTSATNTSLKIDIQALSVSGAAWTYQLTWKRTLDRTGTLVVNSKDKTVTALTLDPVSREGTAVLTLNPGTRYRIEFYTQPGKQGNLLLRKFFNTLDKSGNPVSLAAACLGTTTNCTVGANPATQDPGTTNQGTLQPNAISTSSTSTIPSLGGRVYMNMPDNTHGYNGPRGAPDPVVVLNNDYDVRSSDQPSDPAFQDVLRRGGSVPREPRVIQAFTSVGRPFLSGIHFNISGVCENNPKLKIETPNLQIPPGIRFQRGPDSRYTSYASDICTYGTLQGTASSPGRYLIEVKTTSTLNGSTPQVSTTRIYIVVLNTNVYDVVLDNITQPNGQASANPVLGGRARITWNQSATGGSAQFTNYFSDLELWVAPVSAGTNPNLITDNLKRIAVVHEWAESCNNSQRGGNDPLQVGCGSYNWVVGNTTAGNLEPGQYNLFVMPWVPYINRQDRLGGGGVLNHIFNNGGLIPFPGTGDLIYDAGGYGFSYGVGRITIAPTPAGQTSQLTNAPAGGVFGSFSNLATGLSYVRRGADGRIIRQGMIVPGLGSNTDNQGCDGNWTGGVSCGITINANPGETLELRWAAKDSQGRVLGTDWQSEAFISGPYDQGNATELAAIRACTSDLVPGGLGPNPSEAFMSSPEGSKSWVIPSCMSNKSYYLTYRVWAGTYGGGTTLGGVFGDGLLVVNVGLNQQLGEITQNTCRLPQAITGGNCALNPDGTSYNLTFDPLTTAPLPQNFKIFAGPVQTDVQNNCTSPTTCEANVLRGGFGSSNTAGSAFNQPVRVGNLRPNTTYYNRLVATCDGGGTAGQQRELNFTCTTGPLVNGRIQSVTLGNTSDTSTQGCVLPPIIQGGSCSCSGENTAACVAGSMYTATWSYPDGAVPGLTPQYPNGNAPGATFERIVFRAAEGSPIQRNASGQLVPTSPELDAAARSAVSSGCGPNSSCVVKDDNILANSNSATSQETFYRVSSGVRAGYTYWNRVAFVCNYGQPNQRYVDAVWACYTEPGNGVNFRP